MPPDTVFFITDVCFRHSYRMVEIGSNDRLYVSVSPTYNTNTAYYIASIAPGEYDRRGFETSINSAIHSVYATNMNAEYAAGSNTLRITITGSNGIAIKIYTDKEIPNISTYLHSISNWNGGTYDGGVSASCSDNILNYIPSDPAASYICDFLNLQSNNNVYITSPNLGLFDVASPFCNSVIKKSTSKCKLWIHGI